MILALIASALASPFIPVQGEITDSAGRHLNGSVEMTFGLYTDVDKSPAHTLFTESKSVDVNWGVFTAYVGEDG